ncbi:hypothetical protein ACRALDRAFT_1063213 [Sodiomyces alcalophilus JCM 7366]|uniref:uncharacterized protein n=1 Tax=Sodiomyces alcalophilus JCM 7366 TaxID=591952 RepID=UPI0039B5AF30
MPLPAGGYAGERDSTKRPRAKTLSESQWEPYRRIIQELHCAGYTLNHIKHEMRHKHSFAPTSVHICFKSRREPPMTYNGELATGNMCTD